MSSSATGTPSSVDTDLFLARKTIDPRPIAGKRYNKGESWRSWSIYMAGLLLVNYFLAVAFLGCLYGFSQLAHLTLWPKRAFNALSIMLTALLSLGIGYLIGELGKAIRWKILAAWSHPVCEVEYILGIHTPSALWHWILMRLRAKLPYYHSKSSSWRTGVILALFLLFNLFGRLSVAMYGLAFNLDNSIVTIPALYTTNISAVVNSTQYDYNYFRSAGIAGLERWSLPAMGIATLQQLRNVSLSIDSTGVSYTYAFPNYYESGEFAGFSAWNITAHAKCNQLEVLDIDNGSGRDSRDRCTPVDPFCELFVKRPRRWGNIVTWTLRNSAGQNVTKKAYDGTFMGTTFSEIGLGNVYDAGTFAAEWAPRWVWSNLPGNPSRNESGGCGESCAVLDFCTGTPKQQKGYNYSTKDIRFWTCQHSVASFKVGAGSSSPDEEQLQMASRITLEIARVWAVGFTFANGVNPNRLASTVSYDFPGLGPLWDAMAGKSDTNRTVTETWVAALLPKTTIAALAFLDSTAPSATRVRIRDGETNVILRLKVNWSRVGLITAVLCGLQALAIVVGLTWCQGVMLRDDSVFSNAKLLEKLLSEIDGGTAASGKELVNALSVEVRYGTVDEVHVDGGLEMRLWRSETTTGHFLDGKMYR